VWNGNETEEAMTAKLRIKAKGIEIEWEGEVEYLKNDLPDLIAAIVAALGIGGGGGDDDEQEDAEPVILSAGKKFTTAALAAKVKPNTAPELFKVALAKLQISDKIEPATRAQIHGEMKSASRFYKPSMKNNLNNTIDTLLGQGAINEPSGGTYALTQSAQELLQAKI
jgi:hypothetical protein